jgi:hypothetical protein
MKELRNNIRWWLHGMSDLAFDQAILAGYPVPLSRFWLWLAGRIDRLAMLVGGPLK